MNKATFLSLIRQRGPVSDPDMQDLEKLVVTFPYCQSAHLLIAKAAYDKGSMLSNQKLRKAAIYATNRQLLKKLISTTAPVVPVQPVVDTILTSVSPLPEPVMFAPEPETAAPVAEPITTPVLPDISVVAETENVPVTEPAGTDSTSPAVPENIEPAEADLTEDELLNEDFIITEVDLDPELSAIPAEENTSTSPETITEITPEIKAIVKAELPDAVLETGPELPAQALTASPEETHFRETLANFDHYLFQPEKEEPEAPHDEIAAMYQNDALGYWMASSRLGEGLQLKDDLTRQQPYGFHPELLLEHYRQNPLPETPAPVTGPLAEQLNIIDQFLKLTPKMKNMTARIRTEAQEDLSIKSSKLNKNLASENFANILVQQGKIKKAIKIYEHLLLKIPEKKAYFVTQIEKLQNQG